MGKPKEVRHEGKKPVLSKGKKPFNSNRKKPLTSAGKKPNSKSQDSVSKSKEKEPRVEPKLLMKYTRGPGIEDVKLLGNVYDQAKILAKEKSLDWAVEQAARAEVLLTEDSGFLIPDAHEKSKKLTQKSIARCVDITSATKYFELDLKFGPYRFDYTRNGRHLLIGGKRGHVAAVDWVTKKLHCELNAMEEVYDVQWLHLETMFAAAQKNWVHIYDNQGVELHCVKKISKVLRLTFLPYHFLLAAGNENGWLSWLDVSIGQIVGQYNTKEGRLSVLEQNPYNGVLCLGHNRGVVTMWSPTINKPLAKMLCHRAGVQSIAIDYSGKHMATASADGSMKIWDLRNLSGPLKKYILNISASNLSFSQKGCLAASTNNIVQVYQNCHIDSPKEPYLTHRAKTLIYDVNFCPYEDVCGLGTGGGFSSIIVPGSGEPNFDALEANPMLTKSQRREVEVKSLLEKIQPEMIVLDPSVITEVDIPTLKDKVEAKKKLLYLKPPKVDFTPRKKKRGNTARAARVKKIVQESHKMAFVREITETKKDLHDNQGPSGSKEPPSVLDRFRKKVGK